MPWTTDPHSGGVKIPKTVQERTRQRILAYANRNYRDMFTSLDIRFRGPLCYIDAYREPDVTPSWPPPGWHFTREQLIEDLRNKPVHLCRLRYFGDAERWSLAFYTYSNEQYTPCVFHSGSFWGTPEEAFDVGATYLRDR
jgi:hypothetical protein